MRHILLIAVLLLAGGVYAQEVEVFVSRYIPGNYLADNNHRVQFFNPGTRPVSLEGYLMVTRDYSVRLPAAARIGPRSVFTIAKEQAPGVNLILSDVPDFLIRFRLREDEGNYLVLIDRQGNIQEAMYYSPVPNVPFLPERDTLITYAREKLPYYVPPENRQVWSYISVGDGPTRTFVKQGGEWKLSRGNIKPSTDYRSLNVRYFDGIVTLRWTTAFEQNCRFHHLERSEDQEVFAPVARIASQGDSREFQSYEYYEKNVEEDKTYYYRLRSEDIFGNSVFSKIRGLKTEEGQEEFSLEVISGPNITGGALNVRFTSRYAQRVRLKLFDEQMREVAILFNDYVFAGIPNLLKVDRPLVAGRYLILAYTETERFGKQVEVR
ncbi:MAG: hypothetical protein AAGN35_15630 [Bacteroidota bacterium]